MVAPKNKKKYKALVKQIYVIVSMTIAFLSAVELWYYNVGVHWSKGFTGHRTLVAVGIIYCFTYWFFAKMYNAHKIGLFRLVELAFSQFLTFGIADFCLYAASFVWFHNFQKLHITYFILALVVQVFTVAGVIFVCNRLFMVLDEPRKICIIYGNENYKYLLDKMHRFKYRYNILECLPQETTFSDMKKTIDQCEDVYLYEVGSEYKDTIIMYCNHIRREMHITQTIEEIVTRGFEVSHTFDTPFIRNRRGSMNWYYPFVKRVVDIVVALVVLVVFSPVFLITALAIKLYDGGPVFYKQVRLTKGNKAFKIYKFRSMIPDAEKGGARLASQGDDRITPVGHFIRKTRIDELPQMINILKGDMSLVGPRPERPEIAEQYMENLPEFELRLAVKAGLTGYAQVYGKYNTTPLDKLKLDLIYITHQSLTMDLEIVFYTLKIIFIPDSTEGIEAGNDTAER